MNQLDLSNVIDSAVGQTHRAYLWAYAAGSFEDMKAVVYVFCESRAGYSSKSADAFGVG